MKILYFGGLLLILTGVLYFIRKMKMAFDISGEPLLGGGVPILDGVIVPPICVVWGLIYLNQYYDNRLKWYFYIAFWVFLTILTALSLYIIGRISERRKRL
ncbi:MAG: hypothetical protein OHK0029_27530 [Armatimonadaceae bacterium]